MIWDLWQIICRKLYVEWKAIDMVENALTIEQLNLRVPKGFEKRADAIARDVARELARMPVAQSIQLKMLTVPKIVVSKGETNQIIARRIAQSIHTQLHISSQSGQSKRETGIPVSAISSKPKERNRGIN